MFVFEFLTTFNSEFIQWFEIFTFLPVNYFHSIIKMREIFKIFSCLLLRLFDNLDFDWNIKKFYWSLTSTFSECLYSEFELFNTYNARSISYLSSIGQSFHLFGFRQFVNTRSSVTENQCRWIFTEKKIFCSDVHSLVDTLRLCSVRFWRNRENFYRIENIWFQMVAHFWSCTFTQLGHGRISVLWRMFYKRVWQF